MTTQSPAFRSAPWTPLLDYAGKVYDWWPPDTQESFQRMMADPAHRKYFQERGWDQPGSITYRFNSQGFRCDEIQSNSILVLGCSFTMGIGLPVESTWPQLISRAIGSPVITVAWGGASADSCFRMAEYWIPVLEPKLVVMLTPPSTRIELCQRDHDPPVEVFMPESLSHSYNPQDHFLNQWFLDEENQRLYFKKNKLAIRALCQENRVPCLIYDVNDWMTGSREELEYARDYMHAGPRGHRLLADQIYADYLAIGS